MIDNESLDKALDDVVKRGYHFEFTTESSGLYCDRLELRLTPDEFDVAEVYHFSEMVPGQEERALYLISSVAGKGTLVLAPAEIYSENMSFEMAQKLRTHPNGEWICS